MGLRYAFRSVWKDRTFAIVSILVLALGIGANTAIFSVVNAVLLRPLPYSQPDRIVSLGSFYPKAGGRIGWVSRADFVDWQAQARSFDALAIYNSGDTNVAWSNGAERIRVAYVSRDFFRAMGVQAAHGRLFTADEHQQGGQLAAVISPDLWKRWFDGSPQLGQTLRLRQKTFEVVGVLPAGFGFPNDAANESKIWITEETTMDPAQDRTSHNYLAVGRLRDGASVNDAQSEMRTVAARLQQQYPQNANKSVAVVSLHERLVGKVKTTLYMLLGAVGLVLLIACANIANLLLARVLRRRQELAVRTALGASRARLVRQLLAESLVLAIPSGGLGLLIGWWGADALSRLAPDTLPRLQETSLDWRVGAFTFAIAIFASVVFSVAPAFQAAGADINDALRSAGSYTIVGGRTRKMRSALVVCELALSLLLLTGAAVLVRSLMALSGTDPGYDPSNVLVMTSSVPGSTTEDSRRGVAFYRDLLLNARAIPEISEVAAANALPNGPSSNGRYQVEGRPAVDAGDYSKQQAANIVISPGYFHLLGMRLLSGRDFTEEDTAEAQLTCIINETVAREVFANEDPVGRRIKTGMDGSDFMTVVGVVADVKQYGLDIAAPGILYMPYQQHPNFATAMRLMARPRAGTDPASALRRASAQLNPEIAVEFSKLEDRLEVSLAPPRFRTTLLGLFAGLALLLAAVGLYGVMSYMVAQRQKELGVRMALGAAPSDLFRLILGEGARLIILSLAIGVVLSLAAGRVLVGLVYGVSSNDPLTYAAATAVLGAVGLAALYVPARRATLVEPIEALRHE